MIEPTGLTLVCIRVKAASEKLFFFTRMQGNRSFHCDVCGVCLDISLRGNHKCREGSSVNASPIRCDVTSNCALNDFQNHSTTIESKHPSTSNGASNIQNHSASIERKRPSTSSGTSNLQNARFSIKSTDHQTSRGHLRPFSRSVQTSLDRTNPSTTVPVEESRANVANIGNSSTPNGQAIGKVFKIQ